MDKQTKVMTKHIHNLLLGLSIFLILSSLVVNADTAKTVISEVNYSHYYHSEGINEKYHGFLPDAAPEELYRHVRMKATANIDDTPEKETIVLIVVGPKPTYDNRVGFGNWHQAFLLITGTETAEEKKRDFFKLFDTGTHDLEVPAAKPIELHAPPFIFTQPTDVSFRLVDLTGDGTLDVWVESAYGVALISFENGAFKEVFSNYTVTREKFAETPDVEYHYYNAPLEPYGQKYHRFLPALTPKERYYSARKAAIANIDDTPEKETIVLITADTGVDGPQGEWVKAFLLITKDGADGVPKKKELFKLFDTGTRALDVPGKTIKFHSAPFVFRELAGIGSPWSYYAISFELVDLTGDGSLDIWVRCAYGVAVVSFQNGAFKDVCSAYSSPRRKDPMEYIDLDNDGIYEIKIPDRIAVSNIDMASRPEWVSLYEWDGTTYVLNNERFYAENDEFLIRLLDRYNSVLNHYGRFEEYSFYIGLVFYYRGNVSMARGYLRWVAEHGQKQDYVQAAESLLKKLPSP